MIERFVLQPSILTYGGIEVKEDTKFKDKTKDGKIVQSFDKGILTTKIKRESEFKGVKSYEVSTITQEVPVGVVLVYGEDEGYVISPYKFCRIEEAIEQLEAIKE